MLVDPGDEGGEIAVRKKSLVLRIETDISEPIFPRTGIASGKNVSRHAEGANFPGAGSHRLDPGESPIWSHPGNLHLALGIDAQRLLRVTIERAIAGEINVERVRNHGITTKPADLLRDTVVDEGAPGGSG